MKNVLSFVVIAFIINACSVDDYPQTPPYYVQKDYVPGELAVVLQDSVTLTVLADYIYSRDKISIKKAGVFQYQAFTPVENVPPLKKVLKEKKYIDDETVNIYYSKSEGKILAEFDVINFTAEDTSDWKAVKTRFSLVYAPQERPVGVLSVVRGFEKRWIQPLAESNLFRFVGFNTIDRAQ